MSASKRVRPGRLVRHLWVVPAVLFVAGCEMTGCRADNSSGLADATPAAPPEAVFGDATVAGRVAFEGTAPKPQVVADQSACGGVVYDETLVADDAGGLANVLVYLEGPPSGVDASADVAVLDQTGCRFVPRVQGVQVGQTLEVTNGDPTRHNVRLAPERNPRRNLMFATGGLRQEVTFDRAEREPFAVKCDIHPWMTAHVKVFEHPFFATTAPDGGYAITRVPAGSYELVAWHELLGERRRPVEVADAENLLVDVTFARN